MNPSFVVRAAAIVLLVQAPLDARADMLRCNGAGASTGDSKLSVVYKCGQPVATDAFCAPVYVQGSRHPVAPGVAQAVLPCQVVEEWLYDRGPGNLMATVRFRDGKVVSIRYGRLPE